MWLSQNGEMDWAIDAVVNAVRIAADLDRGRNNRPVSIGAPMPRSIMLLSPRVNNLSVVIRHPRLW
jgi:hypothetical protein